MKKRWMAVLVASAQLVGSAQSVGASEGNIAVTVEGKAVVFDQQPEVVHDRTMVPVRAIFEALGGNVQWEEATQTVRAVQGDTTIQLKLGSSIGQVNGEYYNLDAAPLQKNDRTLVPLRFIAEALYQTVQWEEGTRTVRITHYPDLIRAVENHDLEKVKQLLAAPDAQENVQNYRGQTALIVAADLGDLDIVKALLEKGAGYDIQDYSGNTAIMTACASGQVDVVKHFLSMKKVILSTRNLAGNAALDIAKYTKNTEIINLLVEAGAE